MRETEERIDFQLEANPKPIALVEQWICIATFSFEIPVRPNVCKRTNRSFISDMIFETSSVTQQLYN